MKRLGVLPGTPRPASHPAHSSTSSQVTTYSRRKAPAHQSTPKPARQTAPPSLCHRRRQIQLPDPAASCPRARRAAPCARARAVTRSLPDQLYLVLPDDASPAPLKV